MNVIKRYLEAKERRKDGSYPCIACDDTHIFKGDECWCTKADRIFLEKNPDWPKRLSEKTSKEDAIV